MPRVARAAQTLVTQVEAECPKPGKITYGEPDGLNVIRTVRFNKTVGGWLEPLLNVIEDPRVATVEATDKGLTVTFVDTSHADYRHPFPLEAAATVLGK